MNYIAACISDCPNRVVQHGRRCPLVIFRTENGRGWGVKALKSIKKGTFVMEYVGEVSIPPPPPPGCMLNGRPWRVHIVSG